MWTPLLLTLLISATYARTVEFTPENIHELDGAFALVNFFAASDNRCSALEPHWEALEQQYTQSPTIIIGRINVARYPTLRKRYHAASLPTILWFHASTHEHAPEVFHVTPTFTSLSHFVEVKRRELPHGRFRAMDELLHAAHQCADKACFQRKLFELDHEFQQDKHTHVHSKYYQEVALKAREGGYDFEDEAQRLLATSKNQEHSPRRRRLAQKRYNILRHVQSYH